MDEGFEFKGRQLFAGQNLIPPSHSRCACAIEYIEVEGTAFRQDSFSGYEQNDYANVLQNDMIEASDGITVASRRPKDAIERSVIINEAINADKPYYSADLRMAYVQYGVNLIRIIMM